MRESGAVFSMLITLAFLTGLFAGVSLVLARWLIEAFAANRRTDAERMLWVNKSQVRDGQMPIFSDEAIARGQDAPPVRTEPGKPFKVTSPFSKGRMAIRSRIMDERARANGSVLPDDIKNKIVEEAAKAKEQAA